MAFTQIKQRNFHSGQTHDTFNQNKTNHHSNIVVAAKTHGREVDLSTYTEAGATDIGYIFLFTRAHCGKILAVTFHLALKGDIIDLSTHSQTHMPMQILYVQALRALSVPTHPQIQNALNTPKVPSLSVFLYPKIELRPFIHE